MVDQVIQNAGGVVQTLNALVDETLFGAKKDSWPADPVSVQKVFADLGLEEACRQRTTRATDLGRTVGLDLYMVFLGTWDAGEIPSILAPLGLFTDGEATELWNRIEDDKDDVWKWLRPRVQLAYRSYFGQLRPN